jgi:hypothetical protein
MALALATSIYVVVGPFLVTRYPPMTDLPFHAAQSSALAHYFDPSYRFREQFSVHPLAVPYLSMYVLAALLMRVLPMLVAVKLAAIAMLALLPAGLAVMFHGMKKSPLLGLLGLGLVWGRLTHWGFLNFMGALGLFAMAIGFTLLIVDRPTRARQVGLALTLVALFFTHVFRFPFGIAAVLGSALVMLPATRRFRPILWPMAPSLALFAGFWVSRTSALSGDMGPLSLHWERLSELASSLFDGFVGGAEPRAVATLGRALVVVVVVSVVALVMERRFTKQDLHGKAWSVGTTVIALACAAVFGGLFLVLPMQIGEWWYVYPREATAAVFVLLGATPDLPRAKALRAALVATMAFSTAAMGHVVIDNYARFDKKTADFAQIVAQVPRAPKLLYLVFDHSGSTRTATPFIHLPAYVQAERGGFLSFHFAMWGASPLVYRSPNEEGAVVPPKVPTRWEWRPDLFRVKTHGAFFDWFLVRSPNAPDDLFRADPSIERVAQAGTWWLYHRHGASP